jgi:transmembrane sensor
MTRESPNSNLPDEPAEWEALARYLADESPAGEADRLRLWLAEDPARAEVASTLLRSMDRLAAGPPAEVDVEGALRRVHSRMRDDGAPVIPLRRSRPRWMGGVPLRAAAVVLLVVAAALLFQRLRPDAGAVATGQAFSSAVGERTDVRLPDGTRVLLGPASELVLAAGYGAGSREVELRGSALFEVVHDADRPFSVRAGGAEIRDIGTRFAVRNGVGGALRVLVTEGAVELRPAAARDDTGVTLRAGQRAIVEPGGRVVAEPATATESDLGWTQGRLVFDAAPLSEVAMELHRWYGIEMRADPALSGRRLTASFTGDPADRALRVIALAVGAKLEMRGDTAILHGAARAGAR